MKNSKLNCLFIIWSVLCKLICRVVNYWNKKKSETNTLRFIFSRFLLIIIFLPMHIDDVQELLSKNRNLNVATMKNHNYSFPVKMYLFNYKTLYSLVNNNEHTTSHNFRLEFRNMFSYYKLWIFLYLKLFIYSSFQNASNLTITLYCGTFGILYWERETYLIFFAFR